MHVAAAAWLESNGWYKDEANAHLAKKAQRIERELTDAGMKLGPELYKKLDEKLAADDDFATVLGTGGEEEGGEEEEEQAPDKRLNGAEQRPRRTVGSSSSGGEPPAVPQRKGALSKYDVETMRRFKLDPNDPGHRKAYLARKSRAA